MITLSKQEQEILIGKVEKMVEKMVEKICDDYITNNSRIICYIKFGFKEPTILLGLVEMFGKICDSFKIPIPNNSLSDIVEIAQLTQKNSPYPTSFVLETTKTTSFALELKKAGLNNVSVATKKENEEYREILENTEFE